MKIIRRFRTFLAGATGRALTTAIVVTSLYAFIDPSTYLYALEQQRAKEAEVRAIAAKLGVDPEFLLHPDGRRSFDWHRLMNWAESSLGLTAQPDVAQQPLDIRSAIAQTKRRYALVAADTAIAKLANLVRLASAPERTRKATNGIRGELQSMAQLIDKDLLPKIDDDLPPIAKSRDREMRDAIEELRRNVRSVIGSGAPVDDENLGGTLRQLKSAVAGTLAIREAKSRWTHDPFPFKDGYRSMARRTSAPSIQALSNGPASALVPRGITATSTKFVPAATSVPSDVAAVAQTLDTPAKIFTFVHDRVNFQAYSGVAKGSLGTLKEMAGNDWDQAVLLRDLLIAKGYQAQIEWGRVTVPMEKAMNLAGTEDPLQAANLLATAGFDGQLIMNGSTPVAVDMTHAWVRAFIPYLPNRGATSGTADTWVRMDPSFKRYNYQSGIATNAIWNEDDYLQHAAVQSPADFYSDKVWAYIRANNLDCKNLGQVPKTGTIRADNYPFVPSTLTTAITQTLGLAADPPADQIQRVTVTIAGISYAANLSDLYGKKITVTFPPATPDDAATITSYGGLFNTPAYLVHLKPVIAIDDVSVAEGAGVPAGAALDLNVAFHQPNVADDSTHHNVVAGETHTLVFDAGDVPDWLLTARAQRLTSLTNADAIVSEKLLLIGLRYMQHVDDGLRLAAGLRWHRSVKRVFEADVRRQIDVSYNVAGAPIRLTPAENNIDVLRLLVGVVPIGSDVSHRSEVVSLAGLESSFREGAIWEEMESQQGISAAKALLIARIAGQTLYTVNSGNVDSVLATANLDADVENEIRGAVAQGRIAKLAPNPISLGHWSGTGYLLEDPATGAATYPISGGLAGGSDTGEALQEIKELLGSESWLSGSPLGDLFRQFFGLIGGGEQGPSTTQSDPVNLSSGNMYRSVSDIFLVARGIHVTVNRTYNSRSVFNGPFGYGWTFNYGETLTTNSDGSVAYREADGTEHRFALQGGAYVSPAGKHIALTQSGAGWTMRFKDGTRFVFNADGLLASQSDLNGNTVTINHDGSGNLTTVVDASGRTVLTFAYAGGKISQVTDVGGRIVTYAYTGNDLTTVVDTAGKNWTFGYDIRHNMISLSDPVGHTQRYDYDADDRIMRHTDAAGAEEFFHYDIAARQSVITDRRGGDRLVQYDDLGRATLEADPAGNLVKAVFDADNNRTAAIDSRGHTTTLEFDGNGNMTRQVAPDGGVSTTTYDPNTARPLVSTDATGLVTTNSYDSSGNLRTLSRSVNGVTETTTNTYDGHGQLLSTTDPSGGVSSISWNDNGSQATRTDAASNTTTMTTDALGHITAMRDAAGNTTSLTYDAKDRIATMTDPYTNATTFAYDDAGRRTSVTNPRGTTTYTYDAEGRVTSVKDPLNNTTRTSYSAAGDVLTRTDARGNTTRYEYDAIGRISKMTDAAGGIWTYAYCAGTGGGGSSCSSCEGGGGGSFCDLIDPKGNTIHQEFDVMGRVVSITDSLGHSNFTQYDKAGRKTLDTDANGNATAFAYDDAGRLKSVTEASGAVTSYTYDRNGNKLTQKDANDHTWSFTYDPLNRLVQEKDPLNRISSMTYDAIGNLQTKTDGKGQTTTYTYNVRRLTTTTYADGATENFTYDPLGRRTGMSNANVSLTYAYDTLNRITSVTNQTYGHAVNYTYDPAGNMATRSIVTDGLAFFFAGGVMTTKYAYDGKNRLTTINDPLTGTFRFNYDPMDRRTSLVYPNGSSTFYTYDKAYRLQAIATKVASGAVADAWSYQYDAVGNRISKTDMNGKVEGYNYDNTYRLTEARYGDGTRERFTYDPVGNRKTRTDESGTTITYAYDIANQLLTANADSFTYDGNGNMVTKTTASGTTTMVYDSANRTTSINGPDGDETNTWSPGGQRAQMTGRMYTSITGGSNVTNTSFPLRPIYDLMGNPIADTGNSGTRQVARYRVYGPGIDEPLAETRPGNEIDYLHHDALGSITCATDATGAVTFRNSYRAFGQRTFTDISKPNFFSHTRLSYTSRENSVGTMYQYRSRYYDSGVGRFTQQDFDRGHENYSPSLHRYLYVVNNPVRFIDPSGEREWELSYISITAQVPGFSPAVGVVEWWVEPKDYFNANYGNGVMGISVWYGASLGLWYFAGSTSSIIANQPDSISPTDGWDGIYAYASASVVPVYGVGITMMLFNADHPSRAILAQTDLTTWSGPGNAQGWGFDAGISIGVGYSVSWQ